MMISLEGFNSNCATFAVGEATLAAGFPAQVTGDGTVKTAASGGFAGMVVSVRGGLALVQLTGYVKAKVSEANLAGLPYGYTSVAADTGGQLKGGTGRMAIVTDKDLEAGAAGIILL